MSYLSQEKIKEIRDSVDIVDVISNYVSLTPKGRNYFGVCPFHDDNNPSMSVSSEKKIYKCFSCGATGTVFKFIMDYENVSFVEAVKKVADMSGIDVDIGRVSPVKTNSVLYNIYDLSLKFYINNLNSSLGKNAKEYLVNRGIGDDVIKEFQIGLALNKKDSLTKLLTKKFDVNDMVKSGLVAKGDYGNFDLFQDRIMFPLYNLNGDVVAYSGRIYDKSDNSKYYNTKETEIFKKGELLYNYHKAKEVARRKNQVIIVEGFMDVIRAHIIGVKNVVATMGTAVTYKQAQLIKRMAKEVILCFDGDDAGAKATEACANELIKIGVTPKVVRLEDNMDPDEYILKYGDKFKFKIDNPMSVMDFKLQYLKSGKNLSSTVDEAKYINEVIDEINKIDDEILRELTVKKIVSETNIDESIIRNKIVKPKLVVKSKNKLRLNKYEIAQRNLVYYMLRSPEVINIYTNNISYMPISEYRMLAREIKIFYDNNNYINVADLIDSVECDKDVLLALQKVEDANLSDDYTVSEIDDYIDVIRDYNVKNEISRLKEKMKNEIDPLEKAKIAQVIIDLKKENVNV